MAKILLTSALPYANGSLHIGHMVEYVQTDIFARFLRLMGEDVIYCCADDTHGAPIEIKATSLGIKPEELIEKFYKEHKKDFDDFLIKFDSFYSTNSPENKQYSDLVFNTLKKKGFIYQKEVEITWCPNCKRNLPDRYVKGKCPKCGAEDQYGDVCEKCNATYTTTDLIEPYCTICKKKPVRKKSMHYFFKVNAFGGQLNDWLTTNKNLQPEIVNYIRNWIIEGLQDWDISRDGPYFGFKIPGEEDKYYYVWLDAPIGYIASTQNYCKKHKMDALKDYWQNKDARIMHFIGKDIIYFHFLFWPAVLMGTGFSLPSTIYVHGFLTVNGEKMSKSRGTFFTAREFIEKYNPEYLRFYYAKMLSRKMTDIDLDFKDFRDTVNNEMVANLGNFCYRVLSFLNKNFDGKIAEIDTDNPLIEKVMEKVKKVEDAYNDINTNEAVKEIMAVSDLGNRYFQAKEPWKLVKTDKEEAHKVLGTCVNLVKILSILVSPILPKFSLDLDSQLKVKDLTWKDINFSLKDHRIGKESILINKVELVVEEKFPLDLRVGQVVEAKPHPSADKLIVLQVDLGAEKRQIVAGIRQWYTPESLVGKKIVVVCNLKPAKLRGEMSNGMLLAGEGEGEVGVLTLKDGKPGESAMFGGIKNNTEQITIDDFAAVKLKVREGKPVCKELALMVGKESVTVEKVKKGEIK